MSTLLSSLYLSQEGNGNDFFFFGLLEAFVKKTAGSEHIKELLQSWAFQSYACL